MRPIPPVCSTATPQRPNLARLLIYLIRYGARTTPRRRPRRTPPRP